jgi:hypothetical protein
LQAKDDFSEFAPTTINTTADTLNFVSAVYPYLPIFSLATILSLYPTSSFTANPSANLTAEFYRVAQIQRDILFVCPNFLLGYAISKKCPTSTSTSKDSHFGVYYYQQNQTILYSINEPGLGVIYL